MEARSEDKANIHIDGALSEKSLPAQAAPRKYEISKRTVLALSYWHIAGLYGIYLAYTSAKWQTLVFTLLLYMASNIGMTAGAHRLWSHKAYKAKTPLQLILIVFFSLAFHYTAIDWVRNHRVHHKYTDTDADPHNATRGFFFSHIGWVMVKKHPEVIKKGQTFDFSDIYNDPILRFQRKYAIPFIGSICFIIPTLVPMYFWGESLRNAWHIAAVLRFVAGIHSGALINSFAHMFGNKPYDKNIKATQNMLVSFVTLGEGFHNYHHVFPYDYKAAEFGNNSWNLTTLFIDFFAWIGWAYDLKTVPQPSVFSRSKRTGDGTDLWGEKKNDGGTDETKLNGYCNTSVLDKMDNGF